MWEILISKQIAPSYAQRADAANPVLGKLSSPWCMGTLCCTGNTPHANSPGAIICSDPLVDGSPSPSVGLRKTLVAFFFHVSLPPLISYPFLSLKLPWACPVAVLQACLANPKARHFHCFYFLSLMVPLPLMLLFPEADLALSCSLRRKRHPLSQPVPAATVTACCFTGRQPSSHKGFLTRQGLCACRCSLGLFIPQSRSWFLARSVFMADRSATCCKHYLCLLVVLCFTSSSANHTELS